MSLNLLFTANAAAALVSGFGFVMAPGPALSLLGVSPDPPPVMFARLLGGEFLGYAALTWIGRSIAESRARRAVALACIIGFGIGCVGLLIGKLAGVFNVLGWPLVAVYFLFGAAYCYCYFFGS